MSSGPVQALEEFLSALAAGDDEGVLTLLSDNAAGIDEVSRAWLYGKQELTDYVRDLLEGLSDLSSRLTEVHEDIVGDTAFVTAILEQTYLLDGVAQTIVAPASFGLRRHDGTWRICLFHATPLPD